MESKTFANIVSGEKASTLFSKIKLAISRLIDHLNNRDNPHNTTAAQVGAAAESHTHSAQDINAGILAVANGGTGQSCFADGAIMLGGDTETLKAFRWDGALYSRGVNAPACGVLPIAYGGTGHTSLSDFAGSLLNAGVGLGRIITGNYVGSGGCGVNNKSVLTFVSPPKLLIVQPLRATKSRGGFIVVNGIEQGAVNNSGLLHFDWNNTSVSWYSDTDEQEQQNSEGNYYFYFAIL